MKRPLFLWILFLWILLLWLVFLAFGGFYGGVTMLLDPSGALLGVDSLLPGLFLLFVMGLVPLVLAFGLLARPNWPWASSCLPGWRCRL